MGGRGLAKRESFLLAKRLRYNYNSALVFVSSRVVVGSESYGVDFSIRSSMEGVGLGGCC